MDSRKCLPTDFILCMPISDDITVLWLRCFPRNFSPNSLNSPGSDSTHEISRFCRIIISYIPITLEYIVDSSLWHHCLHTFFRHLHGCPTFAASYSRPEVDDVYLRPSARPLLARVFFQASGSLTCLRPGPLFILVGG
ncbi:unnamed protein product [Meganyctiphanes norvegica]|uniref:Uncharacterized protein n=1 Tax=Meganyctiphanes norvegica TaxID=48144 RepID=A0AAV2SCT5_MEGNR